MYTTSRRELFLLVRPKITDRKYSGEINPGYSKSRVTSRVTTRVLSGTLAPVVILDSIVIWVKVYVCTYV